MTHDQRLLLWVTILLVLNSCLFITTAESQVLPPEEREGSGREGGPGDKNDGDGGPRPPITGSTMIPLFPREGYQLFLVTMDSTTPPHILDPKWNEIVTAVATAVNVSQPHVSFQGNKMQPDRTTRTTLQIQAVLCDGCLHVRRVHRLLTLDPEGVFQAFGYDNSTIVVVRDNTNRAEPDTALPMISSSTTTFSTTEKPSRSDNGDIFAQGPVPSPGANSSTLIIVVVVSLVLILAVVILLFIFVFRRTKRRHSNNKQQATEGEEGTTSDANRKMMMGNSSVVEDVSLSKLAATNLDGATLSSRASEHQAEGEFESYRNLQQVVQPPHAALNGAVPLPRTSSDGSSPKSYDRLLSTSPKSFGADETSSSLGSSTGVVSTDWGEDRPSALTFRKGKMIGQGGFGRVFVGMDDNTGRLLAAKEISFADDPRPELKLRLLAREISLMKRLHHPNLVQYLGADKAGGTDVYIFMEFLPGGSLRSMITSYGKLNQKVTVKYLKQALEGLAYLHEERVVHRDIKAANMLLDRDGVLKLADMGCSQNFGSVQSMKGTPYWIAPEVIRSESAQVGAPSDIWSLGCTVIEMLTGGIPFEWFGNSFLVMKTVGSGGADFENLFETMPDEIKKRRPKAYEFIRQCCAFHPEDRPTAVDLLSGPHPFLHPLLLGDDPLLPSSGQSSLNLSGGTDSRSSTGSDGGEEHGSSSAISSGYEVNNGDSNYENINSSHHNTHSSIDARDTTGGIGSGQDGTVDDERKEGKKTASSTMNYLLLSVRNEILSNASRKQSLRINLDSTSAVMTDDVDK